MNELDKVLEKGRALIAFITAGDPDPEVSVKYALALQKGGADVLELGIPFSDPTAEGVQIQDANIRALKAGTNVEKTFEIVGQVRKNSDIPIVLRSYLNPVFRYGYKAFFSACARLGVCGLEVPDLPFEEKDEAADIAREYGVYIISLIAPAPEERIRKIASDAQGFISACGSFDEQNALAVRIGGKVAVQALTPEQAALCRGAAVSTGCGAVDIIAMLGEHAESALIDYARKMKAALRAR